MWDDLLSSLSASPYPIKEHMYLFDYSFGFHSLFVIFFVMSCRNNDNDADTKEVADFPRYNQVVKCALAFSEWFM